MRPHIFSFRTHANLRPPATLYHYSSLEALQKIVECECLHASDALYLNDEQELIQIRRILSRRIDFLLSQNDPSLRPGLRFLQRYLEPEPDTPVYVASFSEKSDDLNQWRGYTPPGTGVCIGFRPEVLEEQLQSLAVEEDVQLRSALLAKVTYVSAEKEDESFDELLQTACSSMDIIDGEVVRAVPATKLFDVGLPFYKNDSFAEELEWRICLTAFNHIDIGFPTSFRVGRSSLIPYSPISLAGKLTEVITSITVGPSPKMQLSLKAVQQFAHKHELTNANIVPSLVPYRSW